MSNPEHSVKRVISAFTLIEMLLTLTLGSLILLSGSKLYSDMVFMLYQQRELFKLQKNAHQILNYLQQQILHSGYQGMQRDNSNFEWFKYQGKSFYLEQNCLVMLQDVNGDGCLGKRARQCVNQEVSTTKEVNKEILAIKLENKGLMVAGKQNKFTPCTKNECSKWLANCQNLQWEKIAGSSDNYIEQLDFSWEKPEKLIKIDLTLVSIDNKVRYSATAFAYILN